MSNLRLNLITVHASAAVFAVAVVFVRVAAGAKP